ncbi:thioredoxin fold domain-containing protein [uncultured Pontibacter sp.]|uniref:thioredoxin family protein n=1 Tax=uncultured Pontibacter sp. TaxID=453356 RepID=UPI0026289075|nr:thioredoxin fold domain-containing protein [uncultured Pontibacter sp.]
MIKRTAILSALGVALLTGCNTSTPPAASPDTTAAEAPAGSATASETATTQDAEASKSAKIQWLSIEEAAARMKEEPRKVVIDVYTDWCGWCKKMDKSTFTDPEVAQLVNDHFYAVKLDAEGKEPITLNGQTFSFKPAYKSHELAVALLQGQMSFPTTVYLDENMNMLAPVPGYLDAKNFSRILRYFGENHHQKMNFQEYEKQAKGN